MVGKKGDARLQKMDTNQLELLLLKVTRMIQDELLRRAIEQALKSKGLSEPEEEK